MLVGEYRSRTLSRFVDSGASSDASVELWSMRTHFYTIQDTVEGGSGRSLLLPTHFNATRPFQLDLRRHFP